MGSKMKKLLVAVTFSLVAFAAHADGISDPVIDPIVIKQGAADSSANAGGMVLGLITLIIFGTAAAN